MPARLALVLMLFGGLVVFTTAQTQRYCYKKVGYTRKVAERLYVEKAEAVTRDGCVGSSCLKYDDVSRPVTQTKTELVFRTERHCCAGYQRDAQRPDACSPTCAIGCPLGELCVAPNRCDCAESRVRNAEGRCELPVVLSSPDGSDIQLQRGELKLNAKEKASVESQSELTMGTNMEDEDGNLLIMEDSVDARISKEGSKQLRIQSCLKALNDEKNCSRADLLYGAFTLDAKRDSCHENNTCWISGGIFQQHWNRGNWSWTQDESVRKPILAHFSLTS